MLYDLWTFLSLILQSLGTKYEDSSPLPGLKTAKTCQPKTAYFRGLKQHVTTNDILSNSQREYTSFNSLLFKSSRHFQDDCLSSEKSCYKHTSFLAFQWQNAVRGPPQIPNFTLATSSVTSNALSPLQNGISIHAFLVSLWPLISSSTPKTNPQTEKCKMVALSSVFVLFSRSVLSGLFQIFFAFSLYTLFPFLMLHSSCPTHPPYSDAGFSLP